MEQIKEESLAFSQSPLCPIAADVISDGASIYFYMYDLDYEQQRLIARSACWVKNLKAAPDAFDQDAIAKDHQPMLPKQFLQDPTDILPWDEDNIEIVWSKEGHIAALYYQKELYSIIPSWADGKSFSGYTRNLKENTMVGWKLMDAYEALAPRMQAGKAFWAQEFNEVWKAYHTPYFEDLCKIFGKASNCYDLHKDQFPSRLLMTFEKDEVLYAFTIGVGMFAMPNADSYYDDYESYARSEFAIALRKEVYSADEQMEVFAKIAGLCELPWKQMDCLADQHTLDMQLHDTSYCILLDDDHFADALALSIKKQGVHLTWIHPITQEEFKQTKDEQQKAVLLGKLIQEPHTR